MAARAKRNDGMSDKIGNLFGSIRFWQLTMAAVAYGVANPDRILETVAAWFTAVAGVGTIDGINNNPAGK